MSLSLRKSQRIKALTIARQNQDVQPSTPVNVRTRSRRTRSKNPFRTSVSETPQTIDGTHDSTEALIDLTQRASDKSMCFYLNKMRVHLNHVRDGLSSKFSVGTFSIILIAMLSIVIYVVYLKFWTIDNRINQLELLIKFQEERQPVIIIDKHKNKDPSTIQIKY